MESCLIFTVLSFYNQWKRGARSELGLYIGVSGIGRQRPAQQQAALHLLKARLVRQAKVSMTRDKRNEDIKY